MSSNSLAIESSNLDVFDGHVKKAIGIGESLKQMRLKLFISTTHRVIRENENFWDTHARKSKKQSSNHRV